MRAHLIIIVIFILIGFISCREELRTDLNDKILIESFIMHGQDNNTIEIRLFSPLSKSDSSPLITPQNTQISNLSKNVVLFPEFESNGIFKLDSRALKLGEEDILELRINYKGEEIYASTTVPNRTQEIELSNPDLKINYIVDAIPNRITMRWTPESDPDYYLIEIDTASKNPQKINDDRINSDPSNPYINKIGFPISGSEIEISYPSVGYFGRHRIVLHHISKDFYDLYNNPVQGSYNKLNQSVVNGLGIFTAINSDTIYFRVVP